MQSRFILILALAIWTFMCSCYRIRRAVRSINKSRQSLQSFHSSMEHTPSRKRETIYILDGTFMMYYSYFGWKNKQILADNLKSTACTSDSIPTGALMSLSSLLTRFIDSIKPKYVAVAFDISKSTFRHKLYEQYKQQRPETPNGLNSQLACAPHLCDALGLTPCGIDGFEGDDVMASIGSWAMNNDLNVVHVTCDKDMSQLVSLQSQLSAITSDPWTCIMHPVTKEVITRDKIIGKYGLPPEMLCDYFALVGDSADNIPGVKGIGPKIAKSLLCEFGTIEDLYDNILSKDVCRMSKALREVRKKTEVVIKLLNQYTLTDVKVFKKLVTLRDDIPIDSLMESTSSNSLLFSEDRRVDLNWKQNEIITKSNFEIHKKFLYKGKSTECINTLSDFLNVKSSELLKYS